MAKLSTYKRIIFLAMAVTLLLSFTSIFLLFIGEQRATAKPASHPLTISGTYHTQTDAAKQELPSDGILSLPKSHNQVTILGTFNQEIPENEIISLRLDNMYIQFFVNDKLIFSYGEPGSILPYVRSSGNGWQYITSPGITKEDTIRIELENIYSNHPTASYQVFFEQLSMGNPLYPMAAYLQKFLFQWILAMFVILFGFLQAAFAFALTRAKLDGSMYYSLSGFSIFSGIWFMMDFHTLGLFLPSAIAANALQMLSLSLMLCYFLLYVATAVHGKKRLPLRINSWCILLLILFMNVSQMTGYLDLYDFSTTFLLFALVSLSNIFLNLLLELHSCKDWSERLHLLPSFLLLIGAVMDMVLGLAGQTYFYLFETTFIIFSCWHIYLIWRRVNQSAGERAKLQLLETEHEQQRKLLEYQALLTQSTKGLYESIYEWDITHDCAAAESTITYLKELNAPNVNSYTDSIAHICETTIHDKDRQDYLQTLSREAILEAYKKGIDSFQLEFLTSKDGGKQYYWIRLDARIFFWNDDQSVRMITYRQNIDSEKQRELDLKNRAEFDALTGLLKRDAVMFQMNAFITEAAPSEIICCFLMDIDDFKDINDSLGHIAGDYALCQFAALLKKQFRSNDLVGRLGGDEFIVLAKMADLNAVRTKASHILEVLSKTSLEFDSKPFHLASSIGISWSTKECAQFDTLYKESDEALYRSKKMGKHCYSL